MPLGRARSGFWGPSYGTGNGSPTASAMLAGQRDADAAHQAFSTAMEHLEPTLETDHPDSLEARRLAEETASAD